MSASLATRRLLAAVLAAGSLVGATALPAAAHDDDRHDRRAARHSALAIGDVQHESRTRGRTVNDLNREWVEVRNNGRQAVELRGFTLTDREGNRYRFDRLRLDGRSSVRVHTGQGRDTRTDQSTRTAAARSGTSATPPRCATPAGTSSTPSRGAAARVAAADRRPPAPRAVPPPRGRDGPRPSGRGSPAPGAPKNAMIIPPALRGTRVGE
ncbi:lamin tail domain-containing protein [Streptomyces sp. CS62]|uniref:lamin tail domain-containing protein n=1 Tax=Streptomyces sp. CS62 TaxID=3119268 RepID=UPI002F933E13